jgi:hypothetical protein
MNVGSNGVYMVWQLIVRRIGVFMSNTDFGDPVANAAWQGLMDVVKEYQRSMAIMFRKAQLAGVDPKDWADANLNEEEKYELFVLSETVREVIEKYC